MGNQKLIHSPKMNWVYLLVLVESAIGWNLLDRYGSKKGENKIVELQSIGQGQEVVGQEVVSRCQLASMNQSAGILGNQVFQGNLVTQFDTWGPCFEISFFMKLNSTAKTHHWHNLFQFTATDNAYGYPGDRVPGVWFKRNNDGWDFTVDAGKSYSEYRAWHTVPMKIRKWYSVKIVQKAEYGLAQLSLEVDGRLVYTNETNAIQYNNVKWYQCNKGVKPRDYGPWAWNEPCIGDQIVLSDMAVNPGQTYKGETIFGDDTTSGSDETGETTSGGNGHNVIPMEFIANGPEQITMITNGQLPMDNQLNSNGHNGYPKESISNVQKPKSNGYQWQHNG